MHKNSSKCIWNRKCSKVFATSQENPNRNSWFSIRICVYAHAWLHDSAR